MKILSLRHLQTRCDIFDMAYDISRILAQLHPHAASMSGLLAVAALGIWPAQQPHVGYAFGD